MSTLDEFLSEVVMTGYYLAEPPRISTEHLHDAEMKCLKIIHAFGPMQINQVAEMMHTTKARATQLTHVLENRGYICHHAGTDKRIKIVSVTKEGQKIVNDVRKKYVQLARSIEEHLGKQKTDELCNLLKEITPLTQLASKGGRNI